MKAFDRSVQGEDAPARVCEELFFDPFFNALNIALNLFYSPKNRTDIEFHAGFSAVPFPF